MNIQRVDDVIFLAYIAKYICKPEPHGFLGDTAELQAREEMSESQRFLNARVVGMPEAVHRTWGFQLEPAQLEPAQFCIGPHIFGLALYVFPIWGPIWLRNIIKPMTKSHTPAHK